MKSTLSRQRHVRRLAACCLMAALVLLSGCSKAPAEERLRVRFGQMQTAVLERDPGGFIDGVAEDFVGNDNADRAAMHNILRLQLLRNAAVGVNIGPLDITIDGDRATMNFTMVLTGGAGGMIPERANGWSVHSAWRDGEDGWQVYFAEWEPVL